MSSTSGTSEHPTVLIIDDDDAVRYVTRRMLIPMYNVIATSDAESGLRVIERYDPPLDLLVTDIRMPGLSGYDVIEIVRQHRPTLPIVAISGFAGNEGFQHPQDDCFRWLPKPFSVEAMRTVVAELIARARQIQLCHEAMGAVIAARGVTQPRPGGTDLVAAAWAIHRRRTRSRALKRKLYDGF